MNPSPRIIALQELASPPPMLVRSLSPSPSPSASDDSLQRVALSQRAGPSRLPALTDRRQWAEELLALHRRGRPSWPSLALSSPRSSSASSSSPSRCTSPAESPTYLRREKGKDRAFSPRLRDVERQLLASRQGERLAELERFVRALGKYFDVASLSRLGVGTEVLVRLGRIGPQALSVQERVELSRLELQLGPALDADNLGDTLLPFTRGRFGISALRAVLMTDDEPFAGDWTWHDFFALAARHMPCEGEAQPESSVARLYLWINPAQDLGLTREQFLEMESLDPSMLDAVVLHDHSLLALDRTWSSRMSAKLSPQFVDKLMNLGDGIKVARLGLFGAALGTLGLTQAQIFELIYSDKTGEALAEMLNSLSRFYREPAEIAAYLREMGEEAQTSSGRAKRRKVSFARGIARSDAAISKSTCNVVLGAGARRSKFEYIEQRIAGLSTVEQLRLGIPFHYILSRAGLCEYLPFGYREASSSLNALLETDVHVDDLCELASFEGAEQIVGALEIFARRDLGVDAGDDSKRPLGLSRVLGAIMPLLRQQGARSARRPFALHPANLTVLLGVLMLSGMSDAQFSACFPNGNFGAASRSVVVDIVNNFADVLWVKSEDELENRQMCVAALALYLRHGGNAFGLWRAYSAPLRALGIAADEVLAGAPRKDATQALDRLLKERIALALDAGEQNRSSDALS